MEVFGEIVKAETDKPDRRTDIQRINCTFWDNMEASGIGFDDRVKVLTALSDSLETHFGTLYIP